MAPAAAGATLFDRSADDDLVVAWMHDQVVDGRGRERRRERHPRHAHAAGVAGQVMVGIGGVDPEIVMVEMHHESVGVPEAANPLADALVARLPANRRLPGWTSAQVFFRGVVTNVFDTLRIDSFNTTIIGRSGDTTLAAFNPFTETPVEGVHWKKGPSFGQPSSPSSYQSPRDFNFSVGFRF